MSNRPSLLQINLDELPDTAKNLILKGPKLLPLQQQQQQQQQPYNFNLRIFGPTGNIFLLHQKTRKRKPFYVAIQLICETFLG